MTRSRAIIALVRWRRSAPAVPLALAVTAGQSIVWLLSSHFQALVVGALGVALLTRSCRRLGSILPGVATGAIVAFLMQPHVPLIPEAKDAMIHGFVDGAPRRSVPGEVVFLLGASIGGGRAVMRCRAVELPWRNAARLEDGDEVWVRGEVAPVIRTTNPFSWHSGLYRKGVSGECRARFVSAALSKNPRWTTRVRQHIQDLVFGRIGRSGSSGLFLSMALGYQDLISTQLENACKRLGLTHILVVSGYQVSLVFGCVVALCGLIPRSVLKLGRSTKPFLHITALSLAGCYVVGIGAEMSATRALVAAAALTAQMLCERASSFAQRWGLALLVMQMVWPWCLFDIGVILTFAALFGIGLGVSRSRSSRGVVTFAWVHCTVWLCTSLVIMVWRGTISPVGLIVNIALAAPWSVINCAVGLTALVALALNVPGAEICLRAVVWCNEQISSVLLCLADWSLSGLQLVGVSRWSVCLGLTGIIIFLAHPQSLRRQAPPYRASS